MEEFTTVIYEGGIYRFDELQELIEDTGSFILRREDTAVSTTAVMAVSNEDLEMITTKAEEIGGALSRAPLAGTEIAVVAPSPSERHLPHPTCDIAEFLRRSGAQTILICLARGVGQEPLIQTQEVCLINECDLAVFVFGDAGYCIRNKKPQMFRNLKVPIVVTGGPELRHVPHAQAYVGGFGRRVKRMKTDQDVKSLKKLVEVIEQCLAKRKSRTYVDPPFLSIPALRQSIEDQIPDIKSVLSPSPITIKIDGFRVKLPYDEYSDKISNITIGGLRLKDFAVISRSVLKNHTLVNLQPRWGSPVPP